MKKIIYFRDKPLDVDYDLFYEIALKNNLKVIVLHYMNYDKERLDSGWKNTNTDKIENIFINNDNYKKYIDMYKNEIILFHGIIGCNSKYINRLFKIKKDAKVFIIAERPNYYGNFFIRIARYITRYVLYRSLSFYYNKKITGFFAMGQKGVETYKKLGWDTNKLFPFMYTTKTEDKNYSHKKHKILKCIYIGRFYNQTKGIKLLIDVVKKYNSNEICLDLVGGYGQDFDKIIKKIKNVSNINYIGNWNYNDVNNNIAKYDLAIIPSFYDGWNVITNQAINSEIGIIVSDGATSDELVKNANNGVIIKKRNKKSLKKAINYCINNKQIINEWKNNSKKYKIKISNENVAKYFIQTIEYCCNPQKKDLPQIPWLKGEK